MRQSRVLLLVAAVSAAAPGVVGGARAAEPGPAEIAVLAGGCANCHGPEGRSPGPMPVIAGQPEDYLRERLAAFRSDQVPGTTMMNRIAKGFTEDELAALARHFAAVKE